MLLALRASYLCGSSFEWGEHTGYAHQAGLSLDEINRVAGTGDLSGWAPAEAVLLRAADELCADCAISEDTWAELTSHFDAPALIEVPFIVGQYTMLSMVANALGVPSSPGAPLRPLNHDNVYRVVHVASDDLHDRIVSDEAMATFAPVVA